MGGCQNARHVGDRPDCSGHRALQDRRPTHVRMARIRNTLQLGAFWVTEALIPELRQRGDVEVEDQPLPLEFDAAGRLLPAAE